jgi:amidase
MPTSGGNVSMKTSTPPADAFTLARIRKAGALILAKANLQKFARGGMSISSLGGQVRNPYDLGRTPGGSSGGTGAAIAANFAVLGTGSDTGQSIRSPASANNLVGIRPTRGLVSRAGVIPNSLAQDEIGPITRTVTDAALLLDVMAGYDPADPITAFGVKRIPGSYTQLLSTDALKGARIGVMTNLFGTAERHAEVNQVMEGVIARMAELGAKIIRFELPEYDALAPVVSTSQFEARTVMDRYFAALGPNAPIKSFADFVAAKTSAVQRTLEAEFAVVDGMNSQAYKDRTLNRDKLRLAVAKKIADLDLDAILYPLQKILVAPVTAEDQLATARCPTAPDSRRSPSPAGSPPRPRLRRSACRSVPSCWASTTPSRNSSATPMLSSRRVGCASCRRARRRCRASRSGALAVIACRRHCRSGLTLRPSSGPIVQA